MPFLSRTVSRFSRRSKHDSGGGTGRVCAVFAVTLAIALSAGSANASGRFNSAFECGDVIGKVFDDQNRNGTQDDGEAGLPGVRLATARGLMTVTDKHGRYHVTCAQLPRGGIGSIFLMKLDTGTLPLGYRITSENPRTVRLTPGKVSKLNFGAAGSRVVRLDLAGGAFEPNSTALTAQWGAGIDRLIAVLDQDESVLRVTYRKGAEDEALAHERMRAVSRLVEQRWQKRDGRYALEVDQRMKVGH